MEYLPGRTLREVMAERPAREVLLAMCAKVAGALDAAHEAHILHRDIKPENIVVSERGDVKVVDFGIARRFETVVGEGPRATSASDVVEAMRTASPSTMLMWGPDTQAGAETQTSFGTPAYMAPEVLLGEPSNSAERCLQPRGRALRMSVRASPAPPRARWSRSSRGSIDEDPAVLDDALGPLIARMLRRERALRPPLGEVIAALNRAAARVSTAPPARPAPAPMPPMPAPRRWPVIALAGVALAGVGGGAWTVLHAPSASPSRRRPCNQSSPRQSRSSRSWSRSLTTARSRRSRGSWPTRSRS